MTATRKRAASRKSSRIFLIKTKLYKAGRNCKVLFQSDEFAAYFGKAIGKHLPAFALYGKRSENVRVEYTA